ncbi:hypothetical protein Back2_07570 [Nocardioides baekrokdamisoli]|uniref:Uncharacterized protein n=1 Tax=Nocardioides baekrokdamisoli TaxID=1804624 RepID=A0A3G9IC42_9ACTN|nr:hypothetical protein [Nocardioides baekrokdamisoli]BBH16470.1 hypothetical protein Back2_07570 [Nocardioides baekrokdamisoli]
MSKRSNAVRGGSRRSAAASVGVLGLLIFSTGLSLVAQGGSDASPGGHIAVLVCHRTGSDSNPYVTIYPDASSTTLKGHQAHRDDPKDWKAWKSAGWWMGMHHNAGDPKRDWIHSFTDSKGVFHPEDGNITAAGCMDTSPPPPTITPTPTPTPTCTTSTPPLLRAAPQAAVTPTCAPPPTQPGSVDTIAPAFADPSCTAKGGSAINLAGQGFLTKTGLAATSYKLGVLNVLYTVTGSVGPGGTATVTATPIDAALHVIKAGDPTVWSHTFTALTTPCSKPVVVTPTPTSHPTVVIPKTVHSGLVSVAPATSGSSAMRALGLGLAGVGSVLMLGAMGLIRRTAKR